MATSGSGPTPFPAASRPLRNLSRASLPPGPGDAGAFCHGYACASFMTSWMVLAFAAAMAAGEPAAFSVGTATAAAGRRVFGAIEVPAGVDAATRIDVVVIRGAKPGPVLALGSGAQDAVSREMVLAFGLDHVIVSTDRPKDPQASRYLENTATTRGKPSITVEAGRAGTVEPDDVAALVGGCLSVMRYLKMLPGAPT